MDNAKRKSQLEMIRCIEVQMFYYDEYYGTVWITNEIVRAIRYSNGPWDYQRTGHYKEVPATDEVIEKVNTLLMLITNKEN